MEAGLGREVLDDDRPAAREREAGLRVRRRPGRWSVRPPRSTSPRRRAGRRASSSGSSSSTLASGTSSVSATARVASWNTTPRSDSSSASRPRRPTAACCRSAPRASPRGSRAPRAARTWRTAIASSDATSSIAVRSPSENAPGRVEDARRSPTTRPSCTIVAATTLRSPGLASRLQERRPLRPLLEVEQVGGRPLRDPARREGSPRAGRGVPAGGPRSDSWIAPRYMPTPSSWSNHTKAARSAPTRSWMRSSADPTSSSIDTLPRISRSISCRVSRRSAERRISASAALRSEMSITIAESIRSSPSP